MELEHFLGELYVSADHHRLELDEIVDGEYGAEDEIVELAAGAVGHHLDEAGGGDAHLDEELAEEGLDEALELGVDGRVFQLVLVLVIEHRAVVVDETHQRVRVHGTLSEEKDATEVRKGSRREAGRPPVGRKRSVSALGVGTNVMTGKRAKGRAHLEEADNRLVKPRVLGTRRLLRRRRGGRLGTGEREETHRSERRAVASGDVRWGRPRHHKPNGRVGRGKNWLGIFSVVDVAEVRTASGCRVVVRETLRGGVGRARRGDGACGRDVGVRGHHRDGLPLGRRRP